MRLEGFTDATEIMRAGVYALVKNSRVIYVGRAKAMIARINSHRSIWAAKRKGQKVPDWLPIPGLLFDEIHIRHCRVEDLDRIEREMIDRYKPHYNIILKSATKIKAEISLQVRGVDLRLNPAPTPIERRL